MTYQEYKKALRSHIHRVENLKSVKGNNEVVVRPDWPSSAVLNVVSENTFPRPRSTSSSSGRHNQRWLWIRKQHHINMTSYHWLPRSHFQALGKLRLPFVPKWVSHFVVPLLLSIWLVSRIFINISNATLNNNNNKIANHSLAVHNSVVSNAYIKNSPCLCAESLAPDIHSTSCPG